MKKILILSNWLWTPVILFLPVDEKINVLTWKGLHFETVVKKCGIPPWSLSNQWWISIVTTSVYAELSEVSDCTFINHLIKHNVRWQLNVPFLLEFDWLIGFSSSIILINVLVAQYSSSPLDSDPRLWSILMILLHSTSDAVHQPLAWIDRLAVWWYTRLCICPPDFTASHLLTRFKNNKSVWRSATSPSSSSSQCTTPRCSCVRRAGSFSLLLGQSWLYYSNAAEYALHHTVSHAAAWLCVGPRITERRCLTDSSSIILTMRDWLSYNSVISLKDSVINLSVMSNADVYCKRYPGFGGEKKTFWHSVDYMFTLYLNSY